jgi:hypothetical protein
MTIKQYWNYWKTVGKYRHPLYQLYLYWSDRYKAWWNKRAMDRAVKLANERCLASGKTHYVLPDDKGLPRAFSTDEIELMKRAGRMHRKVTSYDVYKASLYIAQYKNLK